MRSVIGLVFIAIFASSSFAQDTLWSRIYGGSHSELTNSMVLTADGGFTIVGSTYSYGPGTPDSSNIWLIHVDGNGDSLWSHSYGGTRSESGGGLIVADDGGYIISGTADVAESGEPELDGLILKTDANGDSFFARTYGGPGWQSLYAAQQTSDGGLIATGITDQIGTVWNNLWLLRTDASGDTLWTRSYGWEADAWGNELLPATDGGYIVLGSYNDTSWTDPWSAQYWLLKIDDFGDTLWTRTYGDSSYQQPLDLKRTWDGGYILGGTTRALGPNQDYYGVRTSVNGDQLWVHAYGGPNSDWGGFVAVTPDSGFVFAGSSYTSVESIWDDWIVRTDANGQVLWDRRYGRPGWDEPHAVCVTPAGNYAVSGWSQTPGNGYDLWLIEIDPTHPSVLVESPNGGEAWVVFTVDTVRWNTTNAEGLVRIELNRDYPTGWWEVLADSLDDDGWEPVYVTGPVSQNCRLRVRMPGAEISDQSDTEFRIRRSLSDLHLVYPANPGSPVDLWYAGMVAEPDTFSESLRFMNFGDEPVLFFSPSDLQSTEFTMTTTCTDSMFLPAHQMSDCEVNLSFHPQAGGTHRDTLTIATNASNGGNQFRIVIPLEGELLNSTASAESLPTEYALDPAYPNPFNPVTDVGFDLVKYGYVKLMVYNVMGQKVAALVDGWRDAGHHEVRFDGSGLSSGVYIYRLEVNGFTAQHKMLLAK